MSSSNPRMTTTPRRRLALLLLLPAATSAFHCSPSTTTTATRLFSTPDDITKLQEKARALLEKSKAKLVEKEAQKKRLPFFATMDSNRDSVIKSRNESGLITTDGEKMAKLSETEAWERRSLLDVFESEMSENADVYSLASQQLAERDVAASIRNLRKELQMEDYMRIFDKKNRFIGEDN